MKLLIDNQEVPFISITAIENVEQYYASFDVVLPCHMEKDTFILAEDNSIEECRVIKQMFNNCQYTYTAVSKKTFDLLTSVFDAFEGQATLKQVLAKLGVPNDLPYDTISTYWRIPSCKLSSLFSYLSDYAELQSGGAPRFFITPAGKVSFIDLKSILDSGPRKNLSIDPASDVYSIEPALINQPGAVEALVFDKSGSSRKNWLFKKGFGKTFVTINDTTGHEADLMFKRLHNRFFTRYCLSRKISVPNVYEPVYLGDCVSISGIGSFVVVSRSVNFHMVEASPSVSITLSSGYENS